ncbi:TIGR00270 family protein [Candidatus Woesearchaeota archaeon]|nr:TIGR00270 family protein [Candidatus Woesearchaeota archaeon]
MDCDMCGKQQATLKAAVEGTVLAVCEGCGKYGKIVGRIFTAPAVAAKKKDDKAAIAASTETEESEAVVANFGQLIKQKREELGRKQEDGFMKLEDFAKLIGVKESVLHKMETGHYKPSTEEARHIGKVLGLKLIEKAELLDNIIPQPKKDQLTLGDMIKVRKK